MKAIRVLVVAALAAGFLAASAGTASAATTIVVHNGQSIQAAINSAHHDDTISIDHGTYTENLTIHKNGIHLVAHGSTLQPPASATSNNPCMQDATHFPGICVFGDVDSNFNVTKELAGVQIDSLRIQDFPDEGVLALGTTGLTMIHDVFSHNGGYGIFALKSSNVTYINNTSHDNGDAGFYVGESPNANVNIAGNESYRNKGEGILFRDSRRGTISDNNLHDNCSGSLLLDTGAPAPGGAITFRNNTVNRNNRLCPAAEGPPLGGIGVAVVGDDHATVRDNTITNNHQQNGSAFGGGILVLDSTPFGGRPPNHTTVSNNTLSNNTPYDIFYDGSGTGNSFTGNSCATSNNGSCV